MADAAWQKNTIPHVLRRVLACCEVRNSPLKSPPIEPVLYGRDRPPGKPPLSDDFDALFDEPAQTPAIAPAPSADKAPEPVDRTTWMAIYKPGASVRYKGENHTVTHVLISKGELFVGLRDVEGVVPHEKVSVELTEFRLKPRS